MDMFVCLVVELILLVFAVVLTARLSLLNFESQSQKLLKMSFITLRGTADIA